MYNLILYILLYFICFFVAIYKELDYTCIELLESDGILDFFEIEPDLFKYGDKFLVNNDIFVLQYPNFNTDLSFSYGKILSIENNEIIHSSSTEGGSSGSPIIRRCKDNYVIGLHSGGIQNIKKEYKYNIDTTFISILDDIKEKLKENSKENLNVIICIYKPKENDKEINLLHDYNVDIKYWLMNIKNLI